MKKRNNLFNNYPYERSNIRFTLSILYTISSFFGNFAVAHDKCTVCDLCQSLVVRHNNEGLPQFFPQVQEQLMYRLGIYAIQVARWLIGHYNGGIVYQSP